MRVLASSASLLLLLSWTAEAFVPTGANFRSLRTVSLSARQVAATTHEHSRHLRPPACHGKRIQPLRATSPDNDEEGGFVNPYTAFRKWQKELVGATLALLVVHESSVEEQGTRKTSPTGGRC